jgi:hypothetical protein
VFVRLGFHIPIDMPTEFRAKASKNCSESISYSIFKSELIQHPTLQGRFFFFLILAQLPLLLDVASLQQHSSSISLASDGLHAAAT